MFHLGLFDGNLAASTEEQVEAVADDVLVIQDNGFLPQEGMELAGAFAFGTDAQYAYLKTPSWRTITPPYIRPTGQGTTIPTFADIADYRMNPLRAKPLEVLSCHGFQNNAGAQDLYAGILLQQSASPAPQGNIHTMRGVSSTTATADVWSQLTMTWNDDLPGGRYAVVGMECEGTACVGARLLLPGQTLRPGGPGLSAESVQGPKIFRKGRLGTWGFFTSTNMPKVEVYCTAGTASFVVYVDIIRLTQAA